MFISKKTKKLFDDLDNHFKIPSKFEKYVNDLKINHKLILKTKNGFKCTNCNHLFKSNEIKVRDYFKCPSCKRKLLVRTNKLQKLRQRDQFAILERFNQYWIIRAFDLETWYSKGTYSSHVCEYGRQIYDEYFNSIYEIYNDNISCAISGKFINHKTFLSSNWKINRSYYHTLGNYYHVYPYNLKRLLNDTSMKYSQLWDFCKNYKDYFNPIELMKHLNMSFELLVKLKLYNLAIDSTDRYECRNMKEKYKYIKKHLKFIRKYDLDINELNLFINSEIKNIKFIKKYSFVQSDLLERINIYKASKLTNLSKDNSHEYRDYLRMCKDLKFNMKDKKIIYPKNIEEAHNEILKEYETKKNKKLNNKIEKRCQKLRKNIFENSKFIVFPAENIASLIEESSQQNNCVRSYAERIAEKECDIYFMRLKTNKEKSLVTIEVVNNKIVQKRTKNNEVTTKEQDKFLNLWERKVLKG